MKIKLDVKLTSLKNEPILFNGAETDLKGALQAVLITRLPVDKEKSQEELYKLWALTKKLDEKAPDFAVEDIVIFKKRLYDAELAPILYGTCVDLLEGKS